MNIDIQFQTIVASLLYGLGWGFCYGGFNRTLLHLKNQLLRGLCEIVFDCAMIVGFFFLIVKINNGNFSVYLYLSLICGVAIYYLYFSYGYLYQLEKLMRFFRWIFYPLHFIFLKISDILKTKKKVRKHARKKKQKTE